VTRARTTVLAAACDAQPNALLSYLAEKGWKLKRRPKCNRPPGHEGPHREYDRHAASIRWEWEW
jgi:hypothetical protein